MRVLMPLPERDFDPSEAGVTYRILTAAGHEIVFATPRGEIAEADASMVTGRGLDPWGWLPLANRLPLVGRILGATPEARAAYQAMHASAAYRAPLAYAALDPAAFEALVLPGGHRAEGMRAYLESAALQSVVAACFDAGKPVASICHGVVLAARSRSAATGRSVLHGRRTTALTWPLERTAARLGRIVRFWDPSYFRTYPEAPGEAVGHRSVQAEVTRALARPGDFRAPQRSEPDFASKTSGRARDTDLDARPAFVVRDGLYVSARWPGDVHLFARTFAGVLAGN